MPNQAFKLTAVLAALIVGLAPARAEAKKFGAIPAPMIGLWAWSAQDCTGANADGRVIVEARSVRFNASSFELQGIRVNSDGALRAGAVVNEEGETSTVRQTIELRLVATDRLSIKTGAGGELSVYIRCAPASR